MQGWQTTFLGVTSGCKLTQGGCGVKLGLVYAVIPWLFRYSCGLTEPKEILMRFSLYRRQRAWEAHVGQFRAQPLRLIALASSGVGCTRRYLQRHGVGIGLNASLHPFIKT